MYIITPFVYNNDLWVAAHSTLYSIAPHANNRTYVVGNKFRDVDNLPCKFWYYFYGDEILILKKFFYHKFSLSHNITSLN